MISDGIVVAFLNILQLYCSNIFNHYHPQVTLGHVTASVYHTGKTVNTEGYIQHPECNNQSRSQA